MTVYPFLRANLYSLSILQRVSRGPGEIRIDGANPSAEEVDEGTEEVVETGLDVVLNQRLVETGFTKNDYKNYLKTYTKA